VVAALSGRSTSRYREAHQAAVEAHAAAILASDGRIDVSFNAISHGEVQGTALSEVGPFGVRVVALRPNPIPETAPDMYTSDLEPLLSDTLTGRLPRLDEIASAAAFLVSDQVGATTGAVMNLTCGAIID